MRDAIITLVLLVIAVWLAWWLRGRQATRSTPVPGPRRVLFPFLGRTLSKPALEAALRLARAEGATLVPVYLAEVPRHLPLDVALPRQSRVALALLDAVEQRAQQCLVPVDARIERGRDSRHALREMLAHERYDRIVLAAETAGGGDGFSPEETAWLLANAPGEIVVLRPASEGPVELPARLGPETVAGRSSIEPLAMTASNAA
ncbi:MAG TPA: universal stress protein [Conexibacter sp.]|jgi:nucleotide-binding universal stress UspA family protein